MVFSRIGPKAGKRVAFCHLAPEPGPGQVHSNATDPGRGRRFSQLTDRGQLLQVRASASWANSSATPALPHSGLRVPTSRGANPLAELDRARLVVHSPSS